MNQISYKVGLMVVLVLECWSRNTHTAKVSGSVRVTVASARFKDMVTIIFLWCLEATVLLPACALVVRKVW